MKQSRKQIDISVWIASPTARNDEITQTFVMLGSDKFICTSSTASGPPSPKRKVKLR